MVAPIYSDILQSATIVLATSPRFGLFVLSDSNGILAIAKLFLLDLFNTGWFRLNGFVCIQLAAQFVVDLRNSCCGGPILIIYRGR
jgi:hypothetical protein